MNEAGYLLAICFVFAAIGSRHHFFNYSLYLAFSFKVFASLFSLYLIVNNYDYGDLKTYYDDAIERSTLSDLGLSSLPLPTGSHLVSLLNGVVFLILPPSLNGLALIAGALSFIYSLLLYESYKNYLSSLGKWALFLLLFFMPVHSVMSGYIGKEGLICVCTAFVISRLRGEALSSQLCTFACILLVFLLRPYQGLALGLALSFAVTVGFKSPFKMLKVLWPIILVFTSGIYIYWDYLHYMVGQIWELGYGEVLNASYAGGSLILTPPPFPLTFMQNFRPFLWEVSDTKTLVVAIENFLVLILFCILLLGFIVSRKIRHSIVSDRVKIFSATYIILIMILFSHSSNIGDLTRRHVYFYPLIIFLGLSVLSPAREGYSKPRGIRLPQDSSWN